MIGRVKNIGCWLMVGEYYIQITDQNVRLSVKKQVHAYIQNYITFTVVKILVLPNELSWVLFKWNVIYSFHGIEWKSISLDLMIEHIKINIGRGREGKI